MTTDTKPGKSKSGARIKWFLIGATVLAALLYFTNPDQTAHLKSINEAVDLRFPKALPGQYGFGNDMRMPNLIEYRNYGLFSSTGFGDMTFSYGFLGRVQTTNSISFVAGIPPIK